MLDPCKHKAVVRKVFLRSLSEGAVVMGVLPAQAVYRLVVAALSLLVAPATAAEHRKR